MLPMPQALKCLEWTCFITTDGSMVVGNKGNIWNEEVWQQLFWSTACLIIFIFSDSISFFIEWDTIITIPLLWTFAVHSQIIRLGLSSRCPASPLHCFWILDNSINQETKGISLIALKFLRITNLRESPKGSFSYLFLDTLNNGKE